MFSGRDGGKRLAHSSSKTRQCLWYSLGTCPAVIHLDLSSASTAHCCAKLTFLIVQNRDSPSTGSPQISRALSWSWIIRSRVFSFDSGSIWTFWAPSIVPVFQLIRGLNF